MLQVWLQNTLKTINRLHNMNSNYKSAVHRINNANNSGDLEQLINSFTNLYNLGILTESEYQRLDIKIVDKLIAIGE